MIKIAICDNEQYILDELRGKVADLMKSEKIISDVTCFDSGSDIPMSFTGRRLKCRSDTR